MPHTYRGFSFKALDHSLHDDPSFWGRINHRPIGPSLVLGNHGL